MKIGELARATHTPVQTIRYYEREHLLPGVPRTGGNYRSYGGEHVERLAFVRHCRSLDMSLDEIRVLLRVRDAPLAACDEVEAVLDAHIGHVEARMRELRRLDRQLRALRERCTGAHVAADCGILGELSAAAAAPAATAPHHLPGVHRAATAEPGRERAPAGRRRPTRAVR